MLPAETLLRPAQKTAGAQNNAAFLMSLRARGIQDLNLLRALEVIPREIFVPHRFADLARRPIALPLRCGQTLPEPWLTARIIEALAPQPHHRVLEIGTGSGYATALLARLAREVLSIERFQSLALEAGARLEQLSVANAAVAFGDGLAISPQLGPFDRIVAHGLLDSVPGNLLAALAPDGVLVAARPNPQSSPRQVIVRIRRNDTGEMSETPVCGCRFQPLLPGEAVAL
ncbi:MAG TPA: protein-L-isoaspartate(D-aspartate) O-methyltransferase [Methylocella sp.]|nr:protein-L-isoaspartate(D-aspartate) O-methyltransferase [Methylocella sp.]